MEQHELLLFVVDCLDKLNIPYLITGSMASMAYGEPRFTNDIDIVADVRPDQVEAMKACFPEADFYLETESMKKAIVRGQQFNIIHPSSGLKIDVIIHHKDAFDVSRFGRARQLHISDTRTANFAAPEDVILKKMEYYQKGESEKHLRDIAGMIKISGSQIDRTYLVSWAEKLGLMEIWRSIENTLSP
jgi:hypothetical protein